METGADFGAEYEAALQIQALPQSKSWQLHFYLEQLQGRRKVTCSADQYFEFNWASLTSPPVVGAWANLPTPT
jgi:hypothetical protein